MIIIFSLLYDYLEKVTHMWSTSDARVVADIQLHIICTLDESLMSDASPMMASERLTGQINCRSSYRHDICFRLHTPNRCHHWWWPFFAHCCQMGTAM